MIGFHNYFMYLAYFVEFLLTWSLSYLEAFNTVFGTRDITFIHYGICALPYGIVMILWNEGRKLCVLLFFYFRFGHLNHKQLYQVGGIDV